uniref:Secreted protein n=1 Tax=Steinernema glaseri TaxID=37863 RepID=A0A1I8AHL3_9BILA
MSSSMLVLFTLTTVILCALVTANPVNSSSDEVTGYFAQVNETDSSNVTQGNEADPKDLKTPILAILKDVKDITSRLARSSAPAPSHLTAAFVFTSVLLVL